MQKWLVISYAANIDALASSHHIDDRLPIFRQKGIDIHLLSSPCGVRSKNLRHTRVPSLAPSGIRYEVRYFLRRRTRKKIWFKFWEILLLMPVYPFYFLEKLFFGLDSTWSWFITSSVAAIVLSARNKPDIIYSTGGPVSAHITAMLASLITRIPYVAEFQDPLVYHYARRTKRFFIAKTEALVFKTAKAVIFLTHGAAERARQRNPRGARAITIYPGAPPHKKDWEYKKERTFSISHFGSLAGTRDLDRFFKALELLFEEQPDLPDYFRLSLYGNNGRNVKKQIARFRYREVLNLHGKVKRDKSLSVMGRSDVLLLIQNTDDTSRETIPSKVYEYLHTGRPILALVYRNSELQAILETLGHVVVQADEAAAIKSGLKAYLDGWQKNRLTCSGSESPYTVERAVMALLSSAQEFIK